MGWTVLPGIEAEGTSSGLPRCVVAGAGGQDLATTLGVDWHPELSDCPDTDLVLIPAGSTVTGAGNGHGDAAAVARAEVRRVLGMVQGWLASDQHDHAQLVVVTRNAVSTGTGDQVHDVAGAGVQGLLRSARSEHPGRFALIDMDDTRDHGNPARRAEQDQRDRWCW